MAYLKYITLQDPRLRLSTGQFNNSSQKILKVSTDSECFRTKTSNLLLNPTTLLWKQKLIVMVGAVKRLEFEIANVHQFGYNPDEFTGVLTGSIDVYTDREKMRSWDVVDGGGRRVGVLTATVTDQFHAHNRHASVVFKEVAEGQRTMPAVSTTAGRAKELRSFEPIEQPKPMAKPSRHFITIYSIVGNLNNAVPKMEASFVQVQAGAKKSRTSESKGRGTQNAWVDTLKFIMAPGENQILFIFYGCEGDQEQILYKGRMSLEVFQDKKRLVSHRIQLSDKDGQAGELFVDIRCTSQQENMFFKQTIVKRLQHRYNSQPHKQLQTIQSSRKTQHSSVSTSSPNKPSVVIPNNSIIFSKQRRFSDYNDRQNPIISYLGNSYMFDSRMSSHYRGASIGFGSKEDFTRSFKSNPGVGEYKLPSIWDRY